MDPRLLRLYESELTFVRDVGQEYAREFPKIAARLNLASFDVVDPYVERLLEGFALLAARIQLKIEAEFPTFTQSLLQMVYPHYLAPTPAMAVVQFRPEQTVRGMPQGVMLPSGTELRSLLGTEDQTNCEFRTAHPVQLLPIELTEAEYIGSPAAVAALGLPDQRGVKAAIRFRLKATGEAPFAKLALERLPLFLSGPDGARARLYEQLIANVTAVFVRPTERPLPWQERLPVSSIRALGTEPEEALLPRAPETFDGYRLLQEYYAMPERFLFVELGGLDRPVARCAGKELEIILLLNRSEPVLATGFGPDQLSLFCTPAINLFAKRSDRVNLSEREVEHHVVPDRMRPLDFEVFGVTAVEGYAMDGGAPQPFLPFYAANDLSRNPEHRSYYILRREPRQLSSRARQRGPRSSYLGHEVFISLVDPEQAPLNHALRQLGLDLLCTNRDLPLSMPVGKQHTDFTIAISAPVAAIRCVVGPTPPRPCRSDGEYAWRFLSHLGLNYLSLVDTDSLHGAAALRELLRLYVPSSTAIAARQLEGLLSVACHPIVRRLPGAGPVAAGRGLEVTLTIDETPFGGAGGIVLASVLDRFFAKYVSINAFTETVLRSPERGEVMRWPMRIGQRPVLLDPLPRPAAAEVDSPPLPLAGEVGSQSDRGEGLLGAAPWRYGFYQAMRRLEALYRDRPRLGRSTRPAQDPVRLAQEPSVEFAPATLAGWEPAEDGRPPRLLVNFFGLFGPDGPLPLHLTEYARDRRRNQRDPSFQRFADIFHHRALSLFYRVWANARPTVSFDRPEEDRFALYLGALIGLGMDSLRDRDAMPDLTKLHFAGHLACQTRHAEGLASILSAFFRMPVRIESFIGAWLSLPPGDRTRLADRPQTATLGGTALLGARVWSRQHKFRVVFGPLSLTEYLRLLPGGTSFHRLIPIVRNYAGDTLVWDVNLILKRDEVPPTLLGQQGRLGWTTWLMPRRKPDAAADLFLDASADSMARAIDAKQPPAKEIVS